MGFHKMLKRSHSLNVGNEDPFLNSANVGGTKASQGTVALPLEELFARKGKEERQEESSA